MLTSLVSLQQRNVKKSAKLTKIVNIKEENLHIFWMTWGISMIFSGKIWLMIILKVTKMQGFTLSLSLWKIYFWKDNKGIKLTHHPSTFLGIMVRSRLRNKFHKEKTAYNKEAYNKQRNYFAKLTHSTPLATLVATLILPNY